MTKEDFLVVNSLLFEKDFDELDRVEFWMGYESKTKEHIPDDWLALTPAPFEEPLQRPKDTTDWEAFRREAAKDFVVALISSGNGLNPKNIAYSIEMADELIKQLKEDEK